MVGKISPLLHCVGFKILKFMFFQYLDLDGTIYCVSRLGTTDYLIHLRGLFVTPESPSENHFNVCYPRSYSLGLTLLGDAI